MAARINKINEATGSLGENEENLLTKTKDLPIRTAREVCAKIVGESFYRWSGLQTFFPTLIFHFKEVDKLKKRTQIKIRLTSIHEGDLVDEERIKALGSQCEPLKRLTYASGPVRCNFVSTEKWKTTIYCRQESDAISVLSTILQTFGQPFDPAAVSVTTGRGKTPGYAALSPNLQRETAPEWTRVCIMTLNKVVLLCHGAKRIIEIFRSET
jgi:hypothetical protein